LPIAALATPVAASAAITASGCDADAHRAWRQDDDQQRQDRPGGEGQEAGCGGVPGAGDLPGVDAQFCLGVGGERVVGGQLAGDLTGQAGVQAFAWYRPESSASCAGHAISVPQRQDFLLCRYRAGIGEPGSMCAALGVARVPAVDDHDHWGYAEIGRRVRPP
jgi:hypothetical protein